MDQTVVQTLVAAVNVVHDPASGAQERAAAQKYYEDFKVQNANCHEYGLFLAQPSNSDAVRHLGLSLMEHTCKYQWISLPMGAKAMIKDNLLKLIDSGTKDVLTEPGFLKEKLAAVISEVVKHDWPQSWAEFLPGLGAASQNGAKQVELVLLVLKTVAEDVSIYGEEMREERKKAIISGLQDAAPVLFSFFHVTLGQNFLEIRNENGNMGDIARSLIVGVIGALVAFADFIQPVVAFRDAANVVQACIALLTQEHDSIRTLACEFLLLLFSKKTRLQEARDCYSSQVSLLLEQCSAALSTSSSKCGAVGVDMDTVEAEYRFQKRVCQLLVEIGTLHAYALDELQGARMQHASMMIVLLEHPSLLLSSFTLNFWASVARTHLPNQKPWLEQALSNVLRGTAALHYKKGDPSADGSVNAASVYASMDFATTEEWQPFFAVVKSRAIELAKLLARISPVLAIEVARNEVSTALSVPVSPGMDPNEEEDAFNILDGALSFADSVIDGSLRSFERDTKASIAAKASVSGVSVSQEEEQTQVKSIEESTINNVQQILVLIFESLSQVTVPRHLARRIGALSGYSMFLRYRPQAIPQVVEKLLEAVAFRMPGEEDAYCEDLSVEAVGVRRKATEALRCLCQGLHESMLPYLPELAATVDRMAKEGRIRGQEHAVLVESVVVVSNAWKAYDRQTSLIGNLCDSTLALWSGSEITAVMSSPIKFLELVGTVPEDIRTGGPHVTKEYVRTRRLDSTGRLRYTILNLLCMYTGIVKRVNVPNDWKNLIRGGFVDPQQASRIGVDLQTFRRATTPGLVPSTSVHPSVATSWEVRPLKRQPFVVQLISHVLPNLLSCIRSMHSLWTKDVRSQLPDVFQSIFDISAKDRDSMLGVDDSNASSNDMSDGQAHYLRSLGLWLSSVRDQALQLLGLLCSVSAEVYRADGALQAILGAALSNLDVMQNRHLRVLLKWAVTPLLVDAPDEHIAAVEDAILPALLEHFFQRLQAGWSSGKDGEGESQGGETTSQSDKLSQSKNGKSDEHEEDKNEILEDRALRDFTREYLDLLYRVLRPTTASDDDASQYEGSVGRRTPPPGSQSAVQISPQSQTPTQPQPQPQSANGSPTTNDLPVRCGHALSTPAILAPLLRTAIACLSSVPDSVVGRKACNLCTRVVVLIEDDPQWRDVFTNDMLGECVVALAQSHNQENVTELLTLIALIYTNTNANTSTAGGLQQQYLSKMHQTILQSAGGAVTPEALDELDRNLAKLGENNPGSIGIGIGVGTGTGKGPSVSLRKQRTVFRALLEDVVLSAAPLRARRPRARTGNILTLSDVMYVQSTQRRTSTADGPLDAEGEGDAELELLFNVT